MPTPTTPNTTPAPATTTTPKTQPQSQRAPSPSSPTLSRPTASTPGIRASALQKLYADALTHTLRQVSYPNFASCFPTPAQYVPEALDGLHRDFVGRLEEVCKSEFSALMEEREVVGSLNELDMLIGEGRRRMERVGNAEDAQRGQEIPTPPHLLQPGELLDAHLAPFLREQTASLGVQLEAVQGENQELAGEIVEQRQTMDQLIGGLESLIGDMEGAAKVLGGEEMEGIEGEMREVAMAI